MGTYDVRDDCYLCDLPGLRGSNARDFWQRVGFHRAKRDHAAGASCFCHWCHDLLDRSGCVDWIFTGRALMGVGVGLSAGPSAAAVIELSAPEKSARWRDSGRTSGWHDGLRIAR
jgi:hypothetical protein